MKQKKKQNANSYVNFSKMNCSKLKWSLGNEVLSWPYIHFHFKIVKFKFHLKLKYFLLNQYRIIFPLISRVRSFINCTSWRAYRSWIVDYFFVFCQSLRFRKQFCIYVVNVRYKERQQTIHEKTTVFNLVVKYLNVYKLTSVESSPLCTSYTSWQMFHLL